MIRKEDKGSNACLVYISISMRTVFCGITAHHELTRLVARKTGKIRTHCHKSFVNFSLMP